MKTIMLLLVGTALMSFLYSCGGDPYECGASAIPSGERDMRNLVSISASGKNCEECIRNLRAKARRQGLVFTHDHLLECSGPPFSFF